MKFEEILPALRAGKKISRNNWCKDDYIYINSNGEFEDQNGHHPGIFLNCLCDLEADEWKIVKEKKKVKLKDLTKAQYKYFCRRYYDPNDLYGNNNPNYFDGAACNTCPCADVNCSLTLDNCRFYHKDLYSDKFLNQYVETYDEDDLPQELEDYH